MRSFIPKNANVFAWPWPVNSTQIRIRAMLLAFSGEKRSRMRAAHALISPEAMNVGLYTSWRQSLFM